MNPDKKLEHAKDQRLEYLKAMEEPIELTMDEGQHDLVKQKGEAVLTSNCGQYKIKIIMGEGGW